MFIISSNNQCHVNILIFLCFIYKDLKMTRLESSRRNVLNTYEYGKAALMTENVCFSLHSGIVMYAASCITPV
jgi:hypothetical protein